VMAWRHSVDWCLIHHNLSHCDIIIMNLLFEVVEQDDDIVILYIYIFIIQSCTEHKQNIVNIMVQRNAPSNK